MGLITTAIETGEGWFSRLFGYNQTEDPTIPNYTSNGVDVPMNQDKTVTLWDKYGLNFGTAAPAYDPTVNKAPAQNQTWYSSIWQGARNVTKFVFCPIFTTCPEPLPPEGLTVGGLGGAAGKAVGDSLWSALRPLMPLLIILAVILVLSNVLLSRVGVK